MALRQDHARSKIRGVGLESRRKWPLRFRALGGGVRYYVLPDACVEAEPSDETPVPAETNAPETETDEPAPVDVDPER